MRFKMWSFLSLWVGTCFGAVVLNDLSLEEKVGQVLMVQFHGHEVNEDAQTLIQKIKIGAIIYYNWCNGLTSPEQVQALSAGLQKLAKENEASIPLLIATDQEGGIVARLQSGFTQFPGNGALGATGDPELAGKAAFVMGKELQAVGINMNLAPVVDINSNEQNPVIGLRSFGDEPETVIAFGKEAVAGFQQAGVIPTLKHFPGYGGVAIDPHEDLPVIWKSKEEMEKEELLPFAKLATSTDAIMTAHLLVPSLDSEKCSTLSEKTLQYLREKIGFQGVIISDSLVMDGVLKKCESVDEASIQALNAGCDLLILGGKLLSGAHAGFELTIADMERVHQSLVEAVQTGRIKEERLNQAVERVLAMKNRYLNWDTIEVEPNSVEEKVNTEEHRALAQNIASLALKSKEGASCLNLAEQNVLIVGPEMLQKSLEQASFFSLGKSVEGYFFHNLNPTTVEIENAKTEAKKADVVVVCSYNAWKNRSAAELTRSLLEMEKKVILLVLRDPLDATLFPQANSVFTSLSPSLPSLQALCDRLKELQQEN